MTVRARLLHAALVVIAFASAITFAIVRSTEDPTRSDVVVHTAGPKIGSLDELVDNSEVVVIARAVAVTDGRVFASDPASEGVRSHLVRLEIGAVLAGSAPSPTLTLEEEASNSDGRMLLIDGLRPTQSGDQGFFFLTPNPDPSLPYFATVSTLGRYLRSNTKRGADQLIGARDAGPLAATIAEMGGRRLTDAVIARARDTGRPVGPLPH